MFSITVNYVDKSKTSIGDNGTSYIHEFQKYPDMIEVIYGFDEKYLYAHYQDIKNLKYDLKTFSNNLQSSIKFNLENEYEPLCKVHVNNNFSSFEFYLEPQGSAPARLHVSNFPVDEVLNQIEGVLDALL